MKIIFIISFPPKYEYKNGPKPDFSWLNQKGENIKVWRMDWGHVFAQDVKRFFPEIAYEVWRPDYRADQEYVHSFDDGVVHRSFPAQITYARLPGLKKTRYWTSRQLLQKLYQVVAENREEMKLVLHVPVDFSFLSHIILKQFIDKVPFLHTSHLNPALLTPKVSTTHPMKYLHRWAIKKTYQRHLQLLSDIAVPPDRIAFFRKHTSANVYLMNALNFDFKWAGKKISKTNARKKLGLHPDRFILFSSSRLVPEKQLDQMLLCLAEIKDLDFICIISGAGDREYERYLNDLSRKLTLDSRVSFVGFLTDNLMDYYCAADAFITTSGSEAGPVSAIKAIALGIPVISTDTGIAAYLLKEKNAGVILNRKYTSEWTEKIKAVIENNTVAIIDPEQLGREYGIENATRELVSCYQKSIDNFCTRNGGNRHA